jgi:uncharacterized integral membrane protein (TIGR00697 family)
MQQAANETNQMNSNRFQLAGQQAVALVSSLYVSAQILADVASLRIVNVGGLSIDGGTFVYPFTFTLRDMVHKVAGVTTARLLIVVAAVVNLVMALLFLLVGSLPPDMAVGVQTEFVAVLSPVWRIVVASIVAEMISEFIDGEVYQRWVNRFAHRYQWARVLSSNAVSVPIDSVLFSLIAFGGALPWAVVGAIALSNVLIKGGVTLISMPWIYLVRGRH